MGKIKIWGPTGDRITLEPKRSPGRDTQRSRVYAAEREWRVAIGDKVFGSRLGWLAFVDKVERDRWFRRHYGRRSFIVHDGRGRRRAAAWGSRSITIPRHSRTPAVILHEIAHCASGSTHAAVAGHGWEYASCYLGLVRHFFGIDAANKLRAIYKQKRVRYTKPRRPMSEEQRAACVARLRLYWKQPGE